MNIKEATQDLHTALEEVEFNVGMFKGEHSLLDRWRYLTMWKEVFSSLDPEVPEALQRCGKIRKDLDALYEHSPFAMLPMNSPEIVYDYIETIATTECMSAHIYLNYMGFLYGGQIMKKLYKNTSSMYEFDDIKGAREFIRAEYVPEEYDEEFVQEVRCAFQYHIDIAKALY